MQMTKMALSFLCRCFVVVFLCVCVCVCVLEGESQKREGVELGWGGGHYPQQGNIELAQTNSRNDP